MDNGQPYAETIDFDNFVIDPACKRLEEASFLGHKVRVSGNGGNFPRWSRGGKELLYFHQDGMLTSVPVDAGDEFRPGVGIQLFKGSGLRTGGDVTADGARFLISEAAETPHREIRLFVNWAASLEKR